MAMALVTVHSYIYPTYLVFFFSCERLGQVERESVKQHKLRSHLPLRKDKPPPWQAQLEVWLNRCPTFLHLYSLSEPL